jgi:ribosomal protein L35
MARPSALRATARLPGQQRSQLRRWGHGRRHGGDAGTVEQGARNGRWWRRWRGVELCIGVARAPANTDGAEKTRRLGRRRRRRSGDGAASGLRQQQRRRWAMSPAPQRANATASSGDMQQHSKLRHACTVQQQSKQRQVAKQAGVARQSRSSVEAKLMRAACLGVEATLSGSSVEATPCSGSVEAAWRQC